MRLLCLFWILHCSLAIREIGVKDVKIPGANSAIECERHCDSLTGCQDWIFEESCVVNMSPHSFVQGVSQDGLSLLQVDLNCTMWQDATCGWQVETHLYGECTLDRASPDQCMGYCSEGCVYIQDICEASCQGLYTVELTLDTTFQKLKLLQACMPADFEMDVTAELLDLWGILDESYLEVSASCFGSLLYVVVTMIPHTTLAPTIDFLDALIDAVYNHLIGFDYLQLLTIVNCLENCDECVGYCTSGIPVGETCTEDVPDGCGDLCPDPCAGFGRCYQGQCHPALLDDAIACEPTMVECANSVGGKCREFVMKFLNGTCLDIDSMKVDIGQIDFAGCYGGDTDDDGYKKGLAVFMCYGAIVMEANCSPVIDCLPQHWACQQDPTGGCIELNGGILFEQTCEPAYTGQALQDCYLSLDGSHDPADDSLRLATELLTCVQHSCWDECDVIGGVRDPTRQVCFTPCDGADCVETLEGILTSGVQCDVSFAPPCSLVKGAAFEINYYQEDGPEGTLCQTVTNPAGNGDDSFFVWGTLFDLTNNGDQKSQTCTIVDAIDGSTPKYLGIMAREFTLDPSNFHSVPDQGFVEKCADLFIYYELLNKREYTLTCPSRVLSYIDVITLHTIGAGFDGPTQEITFTTGSQVSLLAMQPRARLKDREKHNWVLNEARLLSHCAPDSFSNCEADEESSINDEYHAACNTVASSSLYDSGDPDDNWTKKYFKDKNGMDDMHDKMQLIWDRLESGSQVSCGGDGCDSNTYAYVHSEDDDHIVYLCNLYWKKGGERTVTLVHEIGHFEDVADLDDVKYGCTACLDLSESKMKRNADNWGFYVDDFCDDCFSPSGIVTTKTRGEIEIQDLKIGDQVLAVNENGDVFFDDIYFLAHFHPLVGSEKYSTLLQFMFSNDTFIDVSPGHLVYLQNQGDSVIGEQHCMLLRDGQEVCTYQAWEATVGSTIFVNNGMDLQPRLINKITRVREKIRNIYTLGGNVLVDNVFVSCYEKNYVTIHSELWLARFMYEQIPFLYKTFYPFLYMPIEFFAQRFIVLTGSLNVVSSVAKVLLLLVLFRLKGYLRFWKIKKA